MNDLSCGNQSAHISMINRRDSRFSTFPCARDPTHRNQTLQIPLDFRPRHISRVYSAFGTPQAGSASFYFVRYDRGP